MTTDTGMADTRATGLPRSRARSRMFTQLGGLGTMLWLTPGLALMFFLFLLPIATVFHDSVIDPTFTLDNYRTLMTDPLYRYVIWNSVRAGLEATVGCVVVGYPVAYLMFRSPPRRRQLILVALLFAFAIGTVPRTFSWLVILGDRGLVNDILLWLFHLRHPVPLLYNQISVFIGMLHVMLPYMVLILFGSMTRVVPTLVPAAITLGARPVIAFFTIFLPLTLPGVIAGAMLIFIYSLGFYLTPAVLGGAHETTVVMQIENLALTSGIWGLGAALSSIMILISLLGALFYVCFTGLSDVASRE